MLLLLLLRRRQRLLQRRHVSAQLLDLVARLAELELRPLLLRACAVDVASRLVELLQRRAELLLEPLVVFARERGQLLELPHALGVVRVRLRRLHRDPRHLETLQTANRTLVAVFDVHMRSVAIPRASETTI